jgi:molybdopterin/thiamine biosynthesis adenylyltransferase
MDMEATMDRSKLLEFFDATAYNYEYHIIGCGAIGSHICEELARIGVPEVHIYDFDTVNSHNITNQMFRFEDIGDTKVHACAMAMKAINPDIKIHGHLKGLQEPYVVNGVCILCVDDIELRKKIVKANYYNPNCAAIMDFRMRLTDAQYYFATGNNQFEKDTLLATMDFTHEEAHAATPQSACGVELSVVYTVKAITAFGIANMVKWLQENEDYKTMAIVNMDTFTVDAFKAMPRRPKKFSDTVNITTAKQ